MNLLIIAIAYLLINNANNLDENKVSYANYIGTNCFAELLKAYLLNDIYEPYKDRLIGRKVRILNSNLSKLDKYILCKLGRRSFMNDLKIKGVYKHYKGDLYIVEDIIYHSETGEKMVAYRALYGDNKLWCRPYVMFLDEVNKNGQKHRFELQNIKSVNEN